MSRARTPWTIGGALILCAAVGAVAAVLVSEATSSDEGGLDDGGGAHAAFQIMWTHKCRGDLSSALAWGERLAAARPKSKRLTVAVHRAIGIFAREDGDEGRARRELETALKIAADDPALFKTGEEIKSWLPDRE